jgi:hypothetical protein
MCGEYVGGHTATRAGADNYRVVGRFQIDFGVIGSGKLQQHALLELYAL